MIRLHPLLAFYAGDTWEITWSCVYADGSAIDLAGAQMVEWTLKNADGTPLNPPLFAAVNSGIAVTDAPSGEILITIAPAQSFNLPFGRYRHSLRVIDSSDLVVTQWLGFIDVKPNLFALSSNSDAEPLGMP